MKYSIDWLKDQIADKKSLEYIFFWGHTAKQEGIIDKACFSQWWPATFKVAGTSYPTAEHWMMANKASLFNDADALTAILETVNPAAIKAIGRQIKNFDASKWEAVAYSFVVEGNLQKFAQHPALKEYLLATGDKIIVEASPVDAIWGIGLPQDAKDASDPLKWRGTNLLGFALMEVRDLLKHKNERSV